MKCRNKLVKLRLAFNNKKFPHILPLNFHLLQHTLPTPASPPKAIRRCLNARFICQPIKFYYEGTYALHTLSSSLFLSESGGRNKTTGVTGKKASQINIGDNTLDKISKGL